MQIASVVALWRYPVKSLQGEPVSQIDVGAEGLQGDRRFAIFDRETGMGVTGRRSPELLFASARLLLDGDVEITLPDGRISEGDEDLSEWLQRPVTLRRADEPGPRRYESPADFEHEAEDRVERVRRLTRGFPRSRGRQRLVARDLDHR